MADLKLVQLHTSVTLEQNIPSCSATFRFDLTRKKETLNNQMWHRINIKTLKTLLYKAREHTSNKYFQFTSFFINTIIYVYLTHPFYTSSTLLLFFFLTSLFNCKCSWWKDVFSSLKFKSIAVIFKEHQYLWSSVKKKTRFSDY